MTALLEKRSEPVLPASRRLSDVLRNPSKNNFDVLRLLSALAVILGHSFALSHNAGDQMDPVQRLVGFAYSGSLAVVVFFLISGIFVTQSLYYEKNSIGFLIRRFFRIWPGLAVCLFLTALAAVAASKGTSPCAICDKSLFNYVLNNSTLNTSWRIDSVFVGRKYSSINGSIWTLPLEVRMYFAVFAFGVFGILHRKLYFLVLTALGFALLVASPALFSGYFATNNAEAVRPVMFFLVGMAIFAAREDIALTPAYLPALLLLVAWAFVPTREFFTLLFVIAATLWIGCSDILARLPKLPGDYSYGVYIYGWPIQQLVVTAFPKIGPYGLFLTAGSLALLCAMASWRLVEKPGQKVGKRLAERLDDPDAWRAPLNGLSALGGVLWSTRRGWLAPVCTVALAACGLAWADNRTDHLPTAPLPVRIVGFGPTPVQHGRPFNVQRNGGSAIWVTIDKPADPADVLVLGGHRLTTAVSGKLLTAFVPMSVIASRGPKPLLVECDSATHRAQSPAVAFVVN
jgi:peptidoglycan/LPS O-acetylase OafA/YrhL